jgi:hypothetical protein
LSRVLLVGGRTVGTLSRSVPLGVVSNVTTAAALSWSRISA